jgi:Mrp family chromosome partitioning ATPase
MKRILNVLKRRYDYVVLDTSPIWNGGGARVSEYEALADGVILVVEAEKVRWEAAMRSKERLKKTNAKIMGAILNKRRFHIPGWLYEKL